MKCLSLCNETGRKNGLLCVSQSDGMKVIGLGWKKQLLRSKIVCTADVNRIESFGCPKNVKISIFSITRKQEKFHLYC